MAGKCPKCGKWVDHVGSFELLAGEPLQDKRHALAYTCPFCQTILGCQLDPITLRADMVEQVVDELFKRLQRGG